MIHNWIMECELLNVLILYIEKSLDDMEAYILQTGLMSLIFPYPEQKFTIFFLGPDFIFHWKIQKNNLIYKRF